MQVRITDGYLQGFVKEIPREMKITSNKREIRISASSNNRESTVCAKIYTNKISRQKPVQSQQNNVRTTFSERCSYVILLTLNRFLLAGKVVCTIAHPTVSKIISERLTLINERIGYVEEGLFSIIYYKNKHQKLNRFWDK